ncbi:MAG: precorrin-6A/cobalt-precorrin-6A reductase [Arenicella sp.]
MKLLILGGTSDARRLAQNLHQRGISVIYSLAGLVRLPVADYTVISGGFSQYGGLVNYLRGHDITGIVDATHPYSMTMSEKASKAARACSLPCWRYHRPAWRKQTQDTWLDYSDWGELLPMLDGKQSLFITVGQVDLSVLSGFSERVRVLLRTAVKPQMDLCDNVHWVKAIGPFALEQEIALMKEHSIDALICKNSGGQATVAKLQAARQLGVSVFMLRRPQPTQTGNQSYAVFSDIDACGQAVLDYSKQALDKA